MDSKIKYIAVPIDDSKYDSYSHQMEEKIDEICNHGQPMLTARGHLYDGGQNWVNRVVHHCRTNFKKQALPLIKALEEKSKEMYMEYEKTIEELQQRNKELEQKLKDNEERIYDILENMNDTNRTQAKQITGLLENQRMMSIALVSSRVRKPITYRNSMKKLVDNS